ncbi:hypothetical protein [Thiothrix subterranea]|uniref:hypothetical protein n=1 Tax=Thiothrix subterranea TaxID=2735563 RepID=UPI00280ABE90|nr:hypothetical protein [Thiothrix subterranea]
MFKKNKVAISVATGILGIVGGITSVQAVHVNPEGTGQVLLFPYFNAQEGYVTNINLVNSTDQTKAVRIRFNEGKTSKDVLDFNIYMSPQDVWTGSIQQDEDGVGSISTTDRSCTYPEEMAATCADPGCESRRSFIGHKMFVDVSAEDTLEGYVEVIEMGEVEDGTIAAGALHNAGKPSSCSAVANGVAKAVINNVEVLSPPGGGLFGSSAIIDVANGTANAIDPVAIDNYSRVPQHTLPDDPIHFDLPSLASGSVSTSEVLVPGANSSNPTWVTTTWDTLENDPCLNDGDPATPACGLNPYPIAHALLSRNIMNEYFVDPSTGYDGHTDWVVTFPMKKLGIFNRHTVEQLKKVKSLDRNYKGAYVCEDERGAQITPEDLGNNDCKRYPDIRASFDRDIYDREETRIKDANFSPNQVIPRVLEREVNVLTFTSTDSNYNSSKTALLSNHKLPEGKRAANEKGILDKAGKYDLDDFVNVSKFVSGWSRMTYANDYWLSLWWPQTETRVCKINGNTQMPLSALAIDTYSKLVTLNGVEYLSQDKVVLTDTAVRPLWGNDGDKVNPDSTGNPIDPETGLKFVPTEFKKLGADNMIFRMLLDKDGNALDRDGNIANKDVYSQDGNKFYDKNGNELINPKNIPLLNPQYRKITAGECPWISADHGFKITDGIYNGVPSTGFALIQGNVKSGATSLFGDVLPHKKMQGVDDYVRIRSESDPKK